MIRILAAAAALALAACAAQKPEQRPEGQPAAAAPAPVPAPAAPAKPAVPPHNKWPGEYYADFLQTCQARQGPGPFCDCFAGALSEHYSTDDMNALAGDKDPQKEAEMRRFAGDCAERSVPADITAVGDWPRQGVAQFVQGCESKSSHELCKCLAKELANRMKWSEFMAAAEKAGASGFDEQTNQRINDAAEVCKGSGGAAPAQ